MHHGFHMKNVIIASVYQDKLNVSQSLCCEAVLNVKFLYSEDRYFLLQKVFPCLCALCLCDKSEPRMDRLYAFLTMLIKQSTNR